MIANSTHVPTAFGLTRASAQPPILPAARPSLRRIVAAALLIVRSYGVARSFNRLLRTREAARYFTCACHPSYVQIVLGKDFAQQRWVRGMTLRVPTIFVASHPPAKGSREAATAAQKKSTPRSLAVSQIDLASARDPRPKAQRTLNDIHLPRGQVIFRDQCVLAQ